MDNSEFWVTPLRKLRADEGPFQLWLKSGWLNRLLQLEDSSFNNSPTAAIKLIVGWMTQKM